jgi:hypothetical protein
LFDDVKQRPFIHTIFADDTDALTSLDLKTYIIEGVKIFVILFFQGVE